MCRQPEPPTPVHFTLKVPAVAEGVIPPEGSTLLVEERDECGVTRDGADKDQTFRLEKSGNRRHLPKGFNVSVPFLRRVATFRNSLRAVLMRANEEKSPLLLSFACCNETMDYIPSCWSHSNETMGYVPSCWCHHLADSGSIPTVFPVWVNSHGCFTWAALAIQFGEPCAGRYGGR